MKTMDFSTAPISPEAESSASDAEHWQLTDLIDVGVLQSIQDTFAKVFGLPTVIVDLSGRNVTEITHRVSFCEDLTRASPVAGPRCRDCDQCAMRRAADTNRPAIFECWNGLYDCAIPIAPKGQVLGHFLCGQILSHPPDLDRFATTAGEIGVSAPVYVDALRDVRVMPVDQYESSIGTMYTLAQMIAEQAAASIDNLKMLQDAVAAKDDAAKLVDELELILEAFRDSFAQPDELSTLETIADQLQRLIPYDCCLIYTIDDGADELVPRVVRDPNPEPFRTFRPRKGVGVWGKVAATGVRRKIEDVREQPDFTPVPGVDVEPEAMLVVPMIRKGTIFGVISLSRLERHVFTDHELRILSVFCAHASLSVQVSRMQAESSRRLHEEQALGELLSTMARALSVDETLSAIGRSGLEVLGARCVLLRCQPDPGAPARVISIGMADADAAELLADVESEIDGCLARRACRVIERHDQSLVLTPLNSGSEVLGIAMFGAPARMQWNQTILDTFVHQSSLGLQTALARERERFVLLQHELLSSLGNELAQAKSREEVRAQLLPGTSEMFRSEVTVLALLDHSPDAIVVHVREGRTTRELLIKPSGRVRFASVRIRGETEPEESVFTAWAQDLFDELARQLGLVSYLSAPVRTPSGIVGGLFVAWRATVDRFSAEQQRLLRVVASAAGATIGNLSATAETDYSLRRRLAELETMARLAERITPLREEAPIIDEVLAALQELAGLEGAVYAVNQGGQWTARRWVGLEPEETGDLTAALDDLELGYRPARHDLSGGARELLTVPMPGMTGSGGAIAGVARLRGDSQRNIVLSAVARFGSLALENASLHESERATIARLESANHNLRRVLSVHETLTAEIIGGHGTQSVAASLAELVDGEVLVLGPLGEVVARSPEDGQLAWSPSLVASQDDADGEDADDAAHGDGKYVATAPAAVEGEVLAWVVARLASPPGELERAALEYGALLVALERLRERTALEVEHRMRGGFLGELFSGEFVEDVILKQASGFGLDLTAPMRIFLIEPVDGELSQGNGHLLSAIASEVAASWPGRQLVGLEGNVCVVLVEEQDAGSGSPPPGQLFEDQLQGALHQRMPTCDLNVAVSRLVRALPEYGRAYAAARRGLDLLRLLGRSGQVVSFRRIGIHEILLQADEPGALLEFISRYVEPLERYDSEHSSKLLASLETFYDASFNLQEAARRLHVHVSTLRYRLARIEELLGVDPKVGDSRLNVELALKAAKALAIHRA